MEQYGTVEGSAFCRTGFGDIPCIGLMVW